MTYAFLLQFAGGIHLAIAMSDIRRCGWRYLRLMAIVAVALAFAGATLAANDAGWSLESLSRPRSLLAFAGVAFGIAWLFINATQQERVTNVQRLVPAIGGAFCVTAAILLTLTPDANLNALESARVAVAPAVANTLLGALLLGVLTSAMLLGHRYLTETQMPIAPLRHLAIVYLAVLAVRVLWSAANALPVWLTDFRPHESAMFFQLVLIARLAVGLGAAAVFAYMAWDCVKRRATQSATAMFYLSMVPVFIGELAGQFLMRTEGLAV